MYFYNMQAQVSCSVILLLGILQGVKLDSVKELVDDFFNFRLVESPEYAWRFGFDSKGTEVEEWTEAAFDRRKDMVTSFQDRAKQLLESDAGVSEQEKLDLRILKANVDQFLTGDKFRQHTVQFNADLVVNYHKILLWSNVTTLDRLQYWYDRIDNYITMVLEQARRIPTDITQAEEYALPCIVVDGYSKVIERITSGDIYNFLIFRPWMELNAQADNETFYNQGKQKCQELKDALLNLKDALNQNYTKSCRQNAGALNLKNGKEYYKHALQFHTSSDWTPEEVFRVGEEEVEKITSQMNKLIKEEGFDSVTQYVDHLLAQPEETFRTSEEAITFINGLIDEYKAMMPKMFTHDYYNNKLEVVSDVSGGLGFYMGGSVDGSRPPRFMIDATNPTQLLKANLYSLVLHEAVPGHHLTASYMSQSEISDFRRMIGFRHYDQVPYNWPFYTSFSEGWGLYAESLGEELGIINNNKRKISELSLASLRAVRLVVDSGLHYYNWTFDEAVSYMKERTTLTQADCESQIKRYLKWPGQACAYKIGEISIRKLRDKAESDLGDKFDIKKFHDAVLSAGPCPLEVVKEQVNEWISSEATSLSSTIVHCTYMFVLLPAAALFLY